MTPHNFSVTLIVVIIIILIKGALSVSEWVRQNGTETAGGGMDWRQVERVVFIDSTWIQTRKNLKAFSYLSSSFPTSNKAYWE